MTVYLLDGGGRAELDRLQLQARVWEPDAEVMLDTLGVTPGWQCLDLGCGAMGVLGPLARRVGPTGCVLGVDNDRQLLAAAADYCAAEGLSHIELLERDAFASGLPSGSFDLVHARFMLAPLGRADELVRELCRLVRPGGIIALQEPDASTWSCVPRRPAWERVVSAIVAAFEAGGGDFNAGRSLSGLLSSIGCGDVQVRAAIRALPAGHPYARLPIQFAQSLRAPMLSATGLSEADLDEDLRAVEQACLDNTTFSLSFVLLQAWARAPLQRSLTRPTVAHSHGLEKVVGQR